MPLETAKLQCVNSLIYISKTTALCLGVPQYGAYTAPIHGGTPPKHVGQKKQNSIAVCCRTVRQHGVEVGNDSLYTDGVTIRYTLMGSRFATHRRGGSVSRPRRPAVPRVSRPTGADRAAVRVRISDALFPGVVQNLDNCTDATICRNRCPPGAWGMGCPHQTGPVNPLARPSCILEPPRPLPLVQQLWFALLQSSGQVRNQ